MKAHAKLAPSEGWSRYSKNRALVDYAISLSRTNGWQCFSPTSETLIFDAPSSDGSLYLEVKEDEVLDVVLYPPKERDPEFDRVASDLEAIFHLRKQIA